MPKNIETFISEKPWILIAVFYISFMACWGYLLKIASDNAPESIEIHKPSHSAK